ncbi:acylphosphatase [Paracandidimonas soli]|uniref:acylphosphatase n=1 Tax=Paracandidimonas soli TaxID=1917182 RepID=A0A4R3UQ21_9BURK|nr:acylphosphatase [Paracandidimonas soli]TCU93905.1 acylphosphatase [Paracandidimonas soli]
MDEEVATVTVVVTGKVQGVGYRHATVRQAHALGVKGWVQNMEDGSVHALLQGSLDSIDRMLAWMRIGPPRARVDDVAHQDSDTEKRYAFFQQV